MAMTKVREWFYFMHEISSSVPNILYAFPKMVNYLDKILKSYFTTFKTFPEEKGKYNK